MSSVKFLIIVSVYLFVTVTPTYSATIDRLWPPNLDGDFEVVELMGKNKVIIKETNIPAAAAKILAKDSNLNYLGDYGGRSFYESPTWLSWYQAKEYCEDLYLELAVLDSGDCWSFIYYRIEPYTHYWTAGKDAENKDQFLIFGRHGKSKLTYMYSRYIKNESCIGVTGSSPYWNQEHCLEQKFVLCQSLVPQIQG